MTTSSASEAAECGLAAETLTGAGELAGILPREAVSMVGSVGNKQHWEAQHYAPAIVREGRWEESDVFRAPRSQVVRAGINIFPASWINPGFQDCLFLRPRHELRSCSGRYMHALYHSRIGLDGITIFVYYSLRVIPQQFPRRGLPFPDRE